MNIEKIKSTIFIEHGHRSGCPKESYYDVTFTVFENDFEIVNWSRYSGMDELLLNGNEISMENLNDMFFPIDGKMLSLGRIIDLIDSDINTKADQWDVEDELDEAAEIELNQELSSPYLTGRL